MKRNEKIEIRVSLDEKTRLAELAQQEGESVSGLIRGLVGKYVALNSPSTRRRLPKWQLAAIIIFAALVGHGLTLVPIHLHEIKHRQAAATQPVFYVHGAIGDSAFGHSVNADNPAREFSLGGNGERSLTVNLAYSAAPDDTGQVTVSICETVGTTACASIFQETITVGRTAPSVLGGATNTGNPVHVFVQEMA